MTFGALKDRITELLTLEGWTNTDTPPNEDDLGNAALAQFSWEAEYLRGSVDVTTVIGTHTYTLVGTDLASWKRITAVACTDGSILEQSSEEELTLDEPGWFVNGNSVPRLYWSPKPDYIRLYPTPSAVKVYRVIGVKCEPDRTDNDTLIPPAVFHDHIARLGAAIYAETYAITDVQQARVEKWRSDAMSAATELRASMSSNRLPFRRIARLSGSPRVRV